MGLPHKIKSIKLLNIILVIILIMPLFLPAQSWADEEDEEENEIYNIIILNSYHQGLGWTDSLVQGITETIGVKSNREIYVEYMDWKRYPTQENLQRQYELRKLKYRDIDIDVIITTDDIALREALKHRAELYDNAPVVFSGVTKKNASEIIGDEKKVTGIYEMLDSAGTLEIAMKNNPGLENVYILNDRTESGIASGEVILDAVQAINEERENKLIAIDMSYLTLESVIRRMSILNEDSIVIAGSYNMDGGGRILEPEELIRRITNANKVPVYCLHDFLMGYGVVGGSLLSGRIHGKEAGNLALQILHGANATDLPMIEEENFIKRFDYTQLTLFGLQEALLPEGSEIINKPFSFFQTYRTIVLVTITIVLLLVALSIGLALNIRRQRKYEKELREQKQQIAETKQLYQLVLEAASDIIWDWDLINNHRSILVDNTRDIFGYLKKEFHSTESWIELMHPEDRPRAEQAFKAHLDRKTRSYYCEFRIKNKNGKYLWIRSLGNALFDENGKAYRLVGSHRDITELKEQELKIQHMAYYDFLTGLANRANIREKINQEIKEAKHNNRQFAILFLDIDNFKMVNDSYGHHIGDQLLIAISRKLIKIMKNQAVARLAGDEFVILIEDFQSKEKVLDYAKEIIDFFENPLIIAKSLCYVSASIGIAFYPEDGESYEELIINADTAMHRAKELGKRNFVVFDQEMKNTAVERGRITNHLRSALDNKRFLLYYQPLVDPHSRRILGFEALIRWRHDNTIILPQAFIGIAEETGLIVPIGKWVLEEACRFIKNIHDVGYGDLTLSVNISPVQLMKEDFTKDTLRIIKESGIDASKLELEITETKLIDFFDSRFYDILDTLRKRGINICLDDFGCGYSSLNYLKQLPISILKIDKSFIADIMHGGDQKNITGMIIALAHHLGLKVVAEGVENEEQRKYLIKNKCDAIQGNLASKPLPTEQVLDILDQGIEFNV